MMFSEKISKIVRQAKTLALTTSLFIPFFACSQVNQSVPARDFGGRSAASGTSKLVIEGIPSSYYSDNLVRFLTSGTDSAFSFKFGSSSAINCDDKSGYSVEKPVGSYADADLTALPLGDVSICLKSKTTAGIWSSPVVSKFTRVAPPSAIAIELPAAGTMFVGQPFGITLQAVDSTGQANKSFSGQVEIFADGDVYGTGKLQFLNGYVVTKLTARKAGTINISLGALDGAGSLTLNSGSVAVSPGEVSGIAFSGAARAIAGTCGKVINVYLLDKYGNPTTATSSQLISLSATSGTMYSDAACTTSINSLTIPSNSSSAAFYYKQSTPAHATLTAILGAFNSTHHVAGIYGPYVTMLSAKASATTSYGIRFPIEHAIPADGKIVVTFPAGFNVAAASGALDASYPGIDGAVTTSVSGQVVTIVRNNAGTSSDAIRSIILSISGIVNHATPLDTYQVTVQTTDNAGTVLDSAMPSEPFSIVAATSEKIGDTTYIRQYSRDFAYIIPWNQQAGLTTSYAVRFYSPLTIDGAGKVEITFPVGVNVSNATLVKFRTFNGAADYDGTSTLAVSGQTVTVTRSGGTTTGGSLHHYILLGNIINPTTSSSEYVGKLQIKDGTNTVVEGPTNVRFTISPVGMNVSLAASPWPMVQANMGATNKTTTISLPSYPTVKWYKSGVVVSGVNSGITNYNDHVASSPTSTSARTGLIDAQGTSIVTPSSPETLSTACQPSYFDYLGSMWIRCKTSSVLATNHFRKISRFGDLELVEFTNSFDRYDNDVVPDAFGNVLISDSGNPGHMYSYDGLLRYDSWNISNWTWHARTIATPEGYLISSIKDQAGYFTYNPDSSERWRYVTSPAAYPYDTPLYDSGYVYGHFGRAQIGGLPSPRVMKFDASTGAVVWNTSTPLMYSYGYDRGVTSKGFFFYDYLNSGISPAGTQTMAMFDKTNGSFVRSVTDSRIVISTVDTVSTHSVVDVDDKIMINTTDGLVLRRGTDFSLHWKIRNALGNKVPLSTGEFIANIPLAYPSGSYLGCAKYGQWTLTPSRSNFGVFKAGETATIYASSSMQAIDPITGIANQVQLVMPNGSKIKMIANGRSSDGGSTWKASLTVPSDAATGSLIIKFEAAQVNVATDTVTSFASPPMLSSGTGITATASITVIQ